jgi:hypothetical protein
MRKRKVIQICVIPTTGESMETLYALCDDGTIWFIGGSEWIEVPEIPQP